VDQVSLHDVVDVEMDDEEGEADVEALEGGGEGIDVIVVDFLVEDARDWCQRCAGAGEDGDVVFAGANWGAQDFCRDIWMSSVAAVSYRYWCQRDGKGAGLVR
jgi:hypothetical protein